MKAAVVIGACFGDEGKGLTTDYLAAKQERDVLIVRFNGGAQAAHTVQTGSGLRHVFKHLGSGSFAGSPTYLSEFFICNPILFHTELEDLKKIGLQPKVFVNENAIVTTPYDMMINQIVEEHRSSSRHGSCGVGINETVERNLNKQFSIQVHELLCHAELLKKLLYIQQEWVYPRLSKLGVEQVSSEWQERLSSSEILEYFLNEVTFFIENSIIVNNKILQNFSGCIFEGAQGLLLDEEKGFFPHVTRSATGLKNVLTIAKETKINTLDVFYVARAYLTRHGAGPLPYELNELPYPRIVDPTNVNNLYQGSLRFAWFNVDLLQQAISADLAEVSNSVTIYPNLMITCIDQLEPMVRIIKHGELLMLPKDEFLEQLQMTFSHFKLWTSHGPTRETVVEQNVFRKIKENGSDSKTTSTDFGGHVVTCYSRK